MHSLEAFFGGQWLLFRTVLRNASQSKAAQTDRTKVNNNNIFIPLTPSQQTQMQGVEVLYCHSHFVELFPPL